MILNKTTYRGEAKRLPTDREGGRSVAITKFLNFEKFGI